ncbi:MAG: Unknown protein [uncultured Sulfurovum sp.]|uniref:Uncharacterized protein n=1 Tax=uncultured Sulfurovum sp. TaxID=269237 RepID=A0A6S6SSM8_9BACT|nr:MAG: Unknown protein [uncultured Sulfurovum sp.]
MEFNYNDGGRSKYFKGHAGDCVVRALTILLNEDYKAIYNFSHNRIGHTPRNGLEKVQDIYLAKGLVYEEISGCADDYYLDEVSFDFIVQYRDHVHAVIKNVINDTHQKSDFYQAEGFWVKKADYEELLKVIYPNEYYEDDKVDDYSLI